MRKQKELRGYSNAYNAYRNLMNEVSELKEGELDVLLGELNRPVKRERAVSWLVEGHLPLVRTIVFKMAWWLRHDAVLDVFDDACVALIEAVRNYDESCSNDFIRYISIEVQNAVKKSLNTYTSAVRRPVNMVDEYCNYDVSLDEKTDGEDSDTRANQLAGNMRSDTKLNKRSARKQVIAIVRGVLDEMHADIFLKLLGYNGDLYTETMLADEYGISIDRIWRIKHECVDSLIDSCYFARLKELLF